MLAPGAGLCGKIGSHRRFLLAIEQMLQSMALYRYVPTFETLTRAASTGSPGASVYPEPARDRRQARLAQIAQHGTIVQRAFESVFFMCLCGALAWPMKQRM